ncbi:MAG: hypothetical protein AAGJ81_14775 [Verrucomicrobiota bacterium]
MNTLKEFTKGIPPVPDEPAQVEGDQVFEPRVSTTLAPEEFTVAFPPPHLPQGQTGACTAHSAVQMLYSQQSRMLGKPAELMSPMALYYRTRELAGRLNEDSGATKREVLTALRESGTIPYRVFKNPQPVTKRPPNYEPMTKIKGFWIMWAGVEQSPHLVRDAMFFEGLTVSVHVRIPEDDMKSRVVARTGIFSEVGNDLSFDGYGHDMCLYGQRVINDKPYGVTRNSWNHKDWYVPLENLSNRRYCYAIFTLGQGWP